jgi:hypothetical protein
MKKILLISNAKQEMDFLKLYIDFVLDHLVRFTRREDFFFHLSSAENSLTCPTVTVRKEWVNMPSFRCNNLATYTTGKKCNFVGQKPTKIARKPSKIAIFVGRPSKLGRRNKVDDNKRFFIVNQRK